MYIPARLPSTRALHMQLSRDMLLRFVPFDAQVDDWNGVELQGPAATVPSIGTVRDVPEEHDLPQTC